MDGPFLTIEQITRVKGKGPFNSRSATISPARTGPMPGSVSSNSADAVFRSINSPEDCPSPLFEKLLEL